MERYCSQECRVQVLTAHQKDEEPREKKEHVRNGLPCPKCGYVHRIEDQMSKEALKHPNDVPESKLTPRAKRLYNKYKDEDPLAL